MAPPFVDGGAILVSVGYRLIPSVSYPDPVKDCVRALRWIEQRAADYGGSSKRLFVGGHSAGGQIAALMSLHPEWLRQAGCAPDAIKATFCLSTTYNRRMVRPELAPGHDQPGPAEAIRPDSPIALAGNARAPFYMGWGTLDDERMERTAGQMIDALTDARCPLVTWQAIPGGNHFSVHLDMDDPDNAWTRLILASMKSDDLVTRSARRAA